jgi:hypothetical protein
VKLKSIMHKNNKKKEVSCKRIVKLDDAEKFNNSDKYSAKQNKNY